MTESFLTITSPTTGLFKEKGSKFISFAHPVADSGQIKMILDGLRKEYFDATHHCYAWILGAEKDQYRAADDGEPNHSAGDPILGQIKSKNLTNTLVVVVRYFGGTKLGVSGLITAYKAAAADALNKATIVEKFITKSITLKFEYSDTSTVMSLLKEFDGELTHQEFKQACKLSFALRIGRLPAFQSRVNLLMATGHNIQLVE